MTLLLAVLLLICARTGVSQKRMPAALDLPVVESVRHREQAQELAPHLALSYARDVQTLDLRQFVFASVQKNLPSDDKQHAFVISRAIIMEANHLQMDPLFLLAVIKTESQFRLKARGRHGEIGLMQVRPNTATWLASEAGLPQDSDLEDPSVNIRMGATYFALLRKSFNGQSAFYISAYNMGPRNVRRLMARKTTPAIYAKKVLRNYKALYQTLARQSGTATTTVALAN